MPKNSLNISQKLFFILEKYLVANFFPLKLHKTPLNPHKIENSLFTSNNFFSIPFRTSKTHSREPQKLNLLCRNFKLNWERAGKWNSNNETKKGIKEGRKKKNLLNERDAIEEEEAKCYFGSSEREF
jgi:hypothetical protein